MGQICQDAWIRGGRSTQFWQYLDFGNIWYLIPSLTAITIMTQAPIQQAMLASVGKEVILLDAWTSNVLRSFSIGDEDQITGSMTSLDSTAAPGHISHLAVAGVGLWVASSDTSMVALYHTESFIHMQVKILLVVLVVMVVVLVIMTRRESH